MQEISKNDELLKLIQEVNKAEKFTEDEATEITNDICAILDNSGDGKELTALSATIDNNLGVLLKLDHKTLKEREDSFVAQIMGHMSGPDLPSGGAIS